MHASCCICGDIFTGIDPEVLHSTPCGHIFHYVCLLTWFQRSKTCPHCRATVDEKKTIKLYFQLNNYTVKDSGTLENEVQSLKFQIKIKDIDLKKLTEEAKQIKVTSKNLRTELKAREETIRTHETTVSRYLNTINQLKNEVKNLTEAKLRLDELEVKLKQYENLETILKGSAADAAEALTLMKDVSDTTILCSCINTLKKELGQYKENSRDLQALLKYKETKLASAIAEISKLQKQLSILHRSLVTVKQDLSYTEKENENLKKRCEQLEGAIISPSSCSRITSPRDKALHRLVNEYTMPNVKNTPSINLDLTITKKSVNTEGTPSSSVFPSFTLGKPFSSNKRKILPRTLSDSDTQCYDGLGGHLKEDVSLTNPAVLHNAIEKRKTNRILPPQKRVKVNNTSNRQHDLLQFGIKKN